jgi:branched-chain amino acid transport system permease protein
MMQILEYSIIGIASGGLYVLAALGFVIIYKSSNVFNFAMGEMMMFGAYLFFAMTVQLHFGWPIAILAALAGSVVLAVVMDRVLLQPLLGQPVIILVMVTLGVGSMIKGAAGMIWGPDIVQMPEFLPRKPIFIGDILVPGKLAWGFLVVSIMAAAFMAYYRFSRAGIAIRATSSDQITAEGMGINVRRIFSLTWAIAGILAGASGIVVGSLNGITPSLGAVALNVLAVVMLAGISSVGGVIIAGIFIGWVETMVGAYLGAAWQNFMPYLVVLLVMTVKPNGLFGEQQIERI